jgi:hypothetical protein
MKNTLPKYASAVVLFCIIGAQKQGLWAISKPVGTDQLGGAPGHKYVNLCWTRSPYAKKFNSGL